MHPHFYWLKKVVRQKGLHLFAYKLKASDFRSSEALKSLKQTFNIDSYEELNDLHYIVVNEEKMKMPVGGRSSGQTVSSSIPIKFI